MNFIKTRILISLTLITFIFSLVGYFIDSNVRQNSIEFEKKALINGVSLDLTDKTLLKNETHYIREINAICKENNIELVNRVIFLGAKKNDRKHYFLPTNRITIYSDKEFETNERYYNANAIFREMNFKKMSKTDVKEGTWFLIGKKKNIDSVLSEIVSLLNRNSNEQFSISKLRSSDVDSREDSLKERVKSDFSLATITKFSIVLISCLVVVLCICLEKRIYTYLSYGYSITEISKKILLKKVLFSFIVILSFFYGISLFIKTVYFTKEYLLKSLVLLFTLIICTFVMLLIIQYRLLNGGLSGVRREKKFSFICVYVLKLYLLFSIFPALSAFSTLFEESTKYLFQTNTTQESNVGNFYPYYIGNNEKDSGLGKIDDILSVNRSILEVIPYEERFLVDTLTYDGNESWKRAVFIDTNYLKHHTIYDINHKKIEIKVNDSRETLIIPKAIKSKEKSIKRLFKNSTDVEPNIKIAENNLSVPTYQAKRNKIEGSDFFLCVVPENRLLEMFPNIIGGMGNYDGLKVLLNDQSAEEYYKKVLPLLDEKGISDNLPAMFDVSEIEKAKIYVYSGNLILHLAQNLYLLGILFILLYYSIFLFIKINQREYIVKRINGYTAFATYRSFYLIFGMESILILFWAFMSSNSSENYLGTSLFILICNVIVSLSSLRLIEKNQRMEDT